MLSLLELIAFKYAPIHPAIVSFLKQQVLSLPSLNTESVLSLSNTFKLIFQKNYKDINRDFSILLIQSLDCIKSEQVLTIVLNELGIYLEDREQIEQTIISLQGTIGALPLEKKEEEETDTKEKKQGLRYYLINDSILGGVFARSIAKLLYKIRKSESFNRFACPVLMILCSLLRNYQNNLSFVDQAVIDQITVIVRKIVNPNVFIAKEDPLFATKDAPVSNFTFNDKKVEMIEKNPEDLVHFRLLRKGEEAS